MLRVAKFTIRAVAAAALVLGAVRASAAPTLRQQLDVRGDFVLFGNTLAQDCASGIPAPTVGTIGNCGNNTGDSGVDVFWQSNPGAGTAAANRDVIVAQAQSTAVLQLPANAVVRYARIYWGANAPGTTFDGAAQLRSPDGVVHDLTADGASIYINPSGRQWYQSSAEITAVLLAQAEPRGGYTLSLADSADFRNQTNETTFAAWWVAVFYEVPGEPTVRQLTLFDGLEYVSTINDAEVTLSGFLVPPGGFDAKLGVVTYEGDSAVTGDSLYFKGYTLPASPPALGDGDRLSNALNPVANFFNGTRSNLGVTVTVAGDLPRLTGAAASMSSFDLDVVDLKAAGAIASGNDAAVIRATSSQDVYALGGFVTSISTLKPDFIETVKSVTNTTRVEGLLPGDTLEYTVSATNTGNDPSIQTVLTDVLPAGLTYVPGSLRIDTGPNPGAKTDAAGDDQGEYEAGTRTLTVRLGAGADASAGGSVAIGEETSVVFRATVDAGASGTLQNQAFVSAAGLSGQPAAVFESSPPVGTGTTNVIVDACLADAQCGGATPACWAAPDPNVCVACTSNAYCGGAAPICDLPSHTCVAGPTLAPAAQEKATEPAVPVPFTLTLTNHRPAAEVFDLAVSAGCAAALSGTADANGNGLPDVTVAGSGGSTAFTLSLTPPGAAIPGDACAAAVTATGEASGLQASASATARAALPATFTPGYEGAAAKVVTSGGTVRFAGTIANNGATDEAFALEALVSASPGAGALAAAVISSDPNGDGDPSDGAPITVTPAIPAFGGSYHVVVSVTASTAGNQPLPAGTRLDVRTTATSAASSAEQRAQAFVGYVTGSPDPGFATTGQVFAPCQTVHLRADRLPSGPAYAIEWYGKASPVRGVDVPLQAVNPWPVSGGSATDAFALAADAPAAITALVVQDPSGAATVLDSLAFTVERAGSFDALLAPARLVLGDDLPVSATVRSGAAAAPYADTKLSYAVTDGAAFMDGTGAFGAGPAVAHLTSGLSVAAGGTAPDSFTVLAPSWPRAGVYRVEAEWQLSCGAAPALAAALTDVEVAPPAPSLTAPPAGALLADATPT